MHYCIRTQSRNEGGAKCLADRLMQVLITGRTMHVRDQASEGYVKSFDPEFEGFVGHCRFSVQIPTSSLAAS